MSLVSEALRKARQEAAERGAARKGVIIRTTVMLPSRRIGLAAGPAAALGGLAVLLAVGVGFAWWALGRNHAGSAPRDHGGATAPLARATAPLASSGLAAEGNGGAATPPGAALAPTASPFTVAPGARVATTLAPGSVPLFTLPEVPTTPGPATESAARTAIAGAPGGAGTLGAAPAEPAPPPQMTARETSPAPERDLGGKPGERERSFRLAADLGDVKLTLDYIAYQPSKAFAGINGQKVVVGSVIEGIRVEEIGPDFVRLRDRHGPLYLRTH